MEHSEELEEVVEQLPRSDNPQILEKGLRIFLVYRLTSAVASFIAVFAAGTPA